MSLKRIAPVYITARTQTRKRKTATIAMYFASSAQCNSKFAYDYALFFGKIVHWFLKDFGQIVLYWHAHCPTGKKGYLCTKYATPSRKIIRFDAF